MFNWNGIFRMNLLLSHLFSSNVCVLLRRNKISMLVSFVSSNHFRSKFRAEWQKMPISHLKKQFINGLREDSKTNDSCARWCSILVYIVLIFCSTLVAAVCCSESKKDLLGCCYLSRASTDANMWNNAETITKTITLSKLHAKQIYSWKQTKSGKFR